LGATYSGNRRGGKTESVEVHSAPLGESFSEGGGKDWEKQALRKKSIW